MSKDKKLVIIYFEDMPDKDLIEIHKQLRQISKSKLPKYQFITTNRKFETISKAELLAVLGVKQE